MGILIDDDVHVVIQGMTGKEGQKGLAAMKAQGTHISCGVTPGKGGQEVENIPVFNSIKEAIEHDPKITTSVMYVPPLLTYKAAMEALDAGIKTIVIFAENVPIKDATMLLWEAKKRNAKIIGPSSVGVFEVGSASLGSIGGKEARMFSKGSVAVLSKSGGMCSETSRLLTEAGIGQRIVVGIGGDVIAGTTYTEILELLEKDDECDCVVIYGEIGGTYEEQIATMLKEKKFTKPVIAFISGTFAESIPKAHAFGHAGAIIEGEQGTARHKKKMLKEAGAYIAHYHHDIVRLVQDARTNKNK